MLNSTILCVFRYLEDIFRVITTDLEFLKYPVYSAVIYWHLMNNDEQIKECKVRHNGANKFLFWTKNYSS